MPGWSEQAVRTAQGGEQVVVHERIVSTVVRTAQRLMFDFSSYAFRHRLKDLDTDNQKFLLYLS